MSRWCLEWIDMVSVDTVVLPFDTMLLALQGIEGLADGARAH